MNQVPEVLQQYFDVLEKKLGYNPSRVSCGNCRFQDNTLSSAHIKCDVLGDDLASLMAVVHPPTIQVGNAKMRLVQGKQAGMERGWFTWPMEFDPIWLLWCFLYEDKEDETASSSST